MLNPVLHKGAGERARVMRKKGRTISCSELIFLSDDGNHREGKPSGLLDKVQEETEIKQTDFMTVIDLIQSRVEAHPDHPAVIRETGSGDEIISYGQLNELVNERLAGFDGLSVLQGDRCGLHATNGLDFIVGGLAILVSGQCLVPVSDDYGKPALEGFVERVQLHRLLETGSSPGLREYESMDPAGVDGQGDRIFRSLEPAFIRFTSGTTNARKGVVIGHGAIMERLEVADEGLSVTEEDRIIWVLPMAHHFLVSILLYLSKGATILLPSDRDAESVLKMAMAHQATLFYCAPQDYASYLEGADMDFPGSLRMAISTSNGLSEDLALHFHEKSGVPLTQALGVIEVGLPVVNKLRARSKPLAMGQVAERAEVVLRSDEKSRMSSLGAEAGVGEICIKAPGMFDAYLTPWMLAEEVLVDGYFATGDLGYFDEENDLYVLGRRKNRINIHGMKFFCEEVEAVINTCPDVLESRVRMDTLNGTEELVADIVPENHGELDIESIHTLCADTLSAHKIPLRFNLVEAIEKTPTGKIKRW